VTASVGMVVLGWRAADDGLFLRVRGHADEVILRCECDRSHWIVREQYPAGAAQLLVSCHNCGQRQSYLFEGPGLPAR